MPVRTIRMILHAIFLTANVLVVVLFIAAAFSDHVAPEKALVFSYLGLTFPFLFFLNLCFILYWLFLFEWKFMLVGVVALLVCIKPVMNYFPFHREVNKGPAENVIKVLTYNVMNFAYKDHSKETPNQIVQYIADSGADIVCLQEYVVNKSEKYLTEKKLNKALSMYPYRSVIELKNNNYHVAGLAVYSKFPLSRSRQIKYDSDDNGSSIHQIDINGKTLTLINNHLESFKLTTEDKKHYAEFLKGIGADTFDDFKGTLRQKLGPAFRKRAEQARAVAEEIEKVDTDYILVCGDFNDTPISYAHRTIRQASALRDAFSTSGKGAGITYNENFFWFRIDHMLYSENMRAFNCTVDKVKYSDHYPLWSYFELN